MSLRRLEVRRSSLAFHGGGEACHQDLLATTLKAFGVRTERAILLEERHAADNDCAHLWNLQDPHEAAAAAEWATQRALAIVVTPLLADRTRLVEANVLTQHLMHTLPADMASVIANIESGGFLEELRGAPDLYTQEPEDWHALRLQVLHNARLVHCLSKSEAEYVSMRYGVPTERIVVAGVAPMPDLPELPSVEQSRGSADFVLVPTSRFETLKNQLNVILAARRLQLPIVMTGEAHDASLCRALAPDHVRFVGLKSREDLLALLPQARVVLHPSFLECASLALIDAAAMAASLVVSQTLSEREHFGELARYVDPHSIDEIASQLQDAWEKAPSERGAHLELARQTRERTWPRSAEALATRMHASLAPRAQRTAEV